MKSNIVDISVFLVSETDKAVLITDAEDEDAVWLPKSQIEIEEGGSGTHVVTAPEWLLHDKGLI